MTLEGRVVTGLRWSLASQLARQAWSFLVGVLLARLLVPSEFGDIALVMVAVVFAQVLLESGLSPALVQRADLRRDHTATAWWTSIGGAGALMALFWLAAPGIAAVLGSADLVGLTRTLVWVFPAAALGVVPRAVLQRNLAFDRAAKADVFAAIASGGVAVWLAWQGYGITALAAQAIVMPALQSAVLLASAPHAVGGRPTRRAVAELWTFSRHVIGSRIVTYWGYNLDNLVVGRLLGSFALGLYTRAYALLLLPLANASRVLNQVLFPAYARMSDTTALAAGHRRAVRAVSIAIVPVAFGLGVTAEPFVIALYTQKWSGVIPVLRILAFALPVVAVRQLYGNLFLARGRPDQQFRLDVAMKLVTLTAIVVGVQWGLPGVAVGIALAIAINTMPQLTLAGRLVGLGPRDAVADAAPALVLGAIMAVVVLAADALLPTMIAWQRLLALVAIGASTYIGLLAVTRPAGARDIWHTSRRRPA